MVGRLGRNRFVDARLAAALASGGRIVDRAVAPEAWILADRAVAPEAWILADRAGNKVWRRGE